MANRAISTIHFLLVECNLASQKAQFLAICHPSSVKRGLAVLTFSFIIALDCEIEPYFSYSLLFDKRTVKRIPQNCPQPIPLEEIEHIFLNLRRRPSFITMLDSYYHDF
jgi:hypothetical protein